MVETEIIFSVHESPDGGYEAPALGFSIYTQADTLDELKVMVQDAVRCHFDPQNAPRLIRLHPQVRHQGRQLGHRHPRDPRKCGSGPA